MRIKAPDKETRMAHGDDVRVWPMPKIESLVYTG